MELMSIKETKMKYMDIFESKCFRIFLLVDIFFVPFKDRKEIQHFYSLGKEFRNENPIALKRFSCSGWALGGKYFLDVSLTSSRSLLMQSENLKDSI